MKLAQHPTVRAVATAPSSAPDHPLDAAWLRALFRELGADDVGFVELDRAALAGDRADILRALPGARALISYVVKMNRSAIRTPMRSIANNEFHHTGDEVNAIARAAAERLEARGVRALSPAMGFPMEMDRFPGKIWVISHKLVAVEAGLGRIGIHRNVIHPRFGNFILLGTVAVDADISEVGKPIDFNPCLECKLCVAACPVGAVKPDGAFDFAGCYTHNYREFMGGFTTLAETIADSTSARDYRRRVTDAESASWWQSLSFGANYKAAYCMSVCPAGEDVIRPYLADKKGFLAQVVKPLQQKQEPVYVVRGSDAEAHAAKRFPHKPQRHVSGSLRPTSIDGFLRGLPVTFQRGQAGDLEATYHFTFTGSQPREATVVIRNRALAVEPGHTGEADLHLTADADTWLAFLRKDRGLLGALVTRKVRIKGPLALMKAFARCFPS